MPALPIDYRRILDALPASVARLNRLLQVTYANARLCHVLGRPEADVLGRSCLELGMTAAHWGAWDAAVRRVFETGVPYEVEIPAVVHGADRVVRYRFASEPGPDGRVASVLALAVAGDDPPLSGAARGPDPAPDPARGKQLENLGLLAGGAAHDLNNFLTVVMGHIHLGLRAVADTGPTAVHLREAAAAADQAADVCRQILTYAARERAEETDVDLNDVVRDLSRVLRPAVPAGAGPDLRLAPDLPAVRGDAGQLRQVVMNLLINAADAVRDAGGTITISTATENALPLSGGGRVVRLEVADTGSGIAADVLPRIFDPFYTTKPVGRGSGLGLAVVQAVVRTHRGRVSAESAPGRTTFRVDLPASGG